MLSKEQKKYLMFEFNNNGKKYDYCLDYKSFLDNDDIYTEFYEFYMEGNEKILDVVNLILEKDSNSKIYIQIYGIESDIIYSDTIILSTSISIDTLKNCFEKINVKYNEYISPSEIGILDNNKKCKYIYIDRYGNEIKLFEKNENLNKIYYFWWD